MTDQTIQAIEVDRFLESRLLVVEGILLDQMQSAVELMRKVADNPTYPAMDKRREIINQMAVIRQQYNLMVNAWICHLDPFEVASTLGITNPETTKEEFDRTLERFKNHGKRQL